jgi:hypothetical protein
MSVLFTFEFGEFYEGGPRVPRSSVRWSAISETLRNTAVASPDGRLPVGLCHSIFNVLLLVNKTLGNYLVLFRQLIYVILFS